MKKLQFWIIATVVIAGLSSCKGSEELRQQLIYFKNLKDSAIKVAQSYEATVQKGDIIGISVSGSVLEKEAAESIILAINTNSSGLENDNATATGSTTGGAYYVNETGEINVPFLGSIKVDGLNRKAIQKVLIEKLQKEITEPVVDIRFLNHKYTVLGEVQKPGPQKIVSDRVTILDAIGNAGDLTLNGKRENIMIIRDNNGQKEIGRLNLNDGNIFSSPYYFIKQDDVVYVEMNKLKIPMDQNKTLTYIQLGLGIITSLALLINIFR
jgi:polysaccharide biosynthesis/export protein